MLTFVLFCPPGDRYQFIRVPLVASSTAKCLLRRVHPVSLWIHHDAGNNNDLFVIQLINATPDLPEL